MKTPNSWAGRIYGHGFIREAATLLVIFLVLIWLYVPSINFSFFFDDYVTLDSSRLASASDVLKSFSPYHAGADSSERVPFYRPLSTYAYFGVMQAVAGANPLYFRVMNLALLGTISFLIYFLIRMLTEDELAGFFGAVLYSLNTSHALTQMWVSCAAELIVTLMATISFLTYVMWVRNHRASCFVISIFAFVLALLSKEIAIAVPGFMLLYELVYGKPASRGGILALGKRLAPFAIVGIAYLIFWLTNLGVPESGAYRLSIGLYIVKNFFQYLAWAVGSYLIGFLNVSRLDTLVVQNLFREKGWWLIFLKFLLVLLGLFFLSWRKGWRIAKDALFSLGWFSLALLPVIFAPDRLYHYYLLLPDVGLMLVIGLIAARLVESLAPVSHAAKMIVSLIFIAAVMIHSTLAIREEEASLARATEKIASIDRQLLEKVPNPPNDTSFVFSGNYGGWWVKNLSPAVRVLYDNPSLNATAMENGRIPEKVERSPSPVYLVDIRDGVVYVTRAK